MYLNSLNFAAILHSITRTLENPHAALPVKEFSKTFLNILVSYLILVSAKPTRKSVNLATPC